MNEREIKELEIEVLQTLRDGVQVTKTKSIPDIEQLALVANTVSEVEVAILYSDLVGSTKLVENRSSVDAVRIHKAFLRCATRCIAGFGGKTVSFDGDRVMGLFAGDTKEVRAIECALMIDRLVRQTINGRGAINPGIRQVTGIDVGAVHATRAGIREQNDIVWVGPAAFKAAKLCAIRRSDSSLHVSERVFRRVAQDPKQNGIEGYTWNKLENPGGGTAGFKLVKRPERPPVPARSPKTSKPLSQDTKLNLSDVLPPPVDRDRLDYLASVLRGVKVKPSPIDSRLLTAA